MTRRHSPAVYRRRRIVVFGGLLIVLAGIGLGIWLLIAQPWSGAATEEQLAATASPQPVATDAAEEPAEPAETEGGDGAESDGAASDLEADVVVDDETDTAAEVQVEPCAPHAVLVEPVANATSYRSDALPQLSIRLTNIGPVDCTLNVGTTTQVFTITSGSDVWWRSTDCQSEPSDMIVTLAAGQTVTTAEPVEWNRTRSAVDTCDQDNRPRAPSGGASYHLSVEIGGVPGAKTEQILLY